MTADAESEAQPEVVPEVRTVIRTLRFEVVWPGWRRTDLLKLWKELWAAQGDLRRAANLTASAMCQLRLGTLPRPTKPDGVTPVSDQTLIYQALSGKWQPFGFPCYQPSEGVRRVASQVLLDLAGTIHTRIKTDWTEIRKGERSLPTWKRVPVGSSTQGITVDAATGMITIGLWEGRSARVTLRPRKLDSRLWGDLRRALKFGSAKLQWDQPPGRKGRWMLSLSVEVPAAVRDVPPLVCAVRLGMATTCTLAYANPADAKLLRRTDAVNLPATVWRAVRRVQRERTERGEWNRKERGLREGHGRDRKLRATAGIGDLVARVTDTAIRQVAAAVIATAVSRGATTLALPDLAHWSVASELDKTAALPEGERADHRKWYFSLHQSGLREAMRIAAERQGLDIVYVPVAGCGKTCSECGAENPAYRVDRRWECPCGCKTSIESNTARVLAKRAVALKAPKA